MGSHWIHARCKATSRGPIGKWAQVKENGWRCTFFVQPPPDYPDDGCPYTPRCVAYGRDDSEHREMIRLFPRLGEYAKHLCKVCPPLSSVDLEMVVPSGCNADVPTALKDPSLPLLFRIFAVPWWGFKNLRLRPLDQVKAEFAERLTTDTAQWVEQHLTADLGDLNEQARKRGLEGWITKEYNYCGWVKWKVEETLDCFITGLVPGRGRLAGKIGSVRIAVRRHDGSNRQIGLVSGFSDLERDEIAIGKVLEVRYQTVGRNGALLLPRFIRWRPDKPWTECSEAQLPVEQDNG